MAEKSTAPPGLAPALELRPMTESAIDDAADLTASAFLQSPNYTYIFEDIVDPERRHEALKWMFSRNMKLRLKHEGLHCGYLNDELVCFFMLEPPGTPGITLWEMVSVGLLEMPFRFGFRAVSRMLERSKFYDMSCEGAVRYWAQRNHVKIPSYCFLERMVVKPKHQGRGIGTYCLGQALKKALNRGHAVYLTTQKDENVTFYSRLGFEVIYTRSSGLNEPDRHMIAASPEIRINDGDHHPVGHGSVTTKPSALASASTPRRRRSAFVNIALPSFLVALGVGLVVVLRKDGRRT